MRTLILGGTGFLGRYVAAQALARRHRLTLFTRGRHGAALFPDATHLRGDRDGDLSALAEGEWDVVVDTSGHHPDAVTASARLLADRADHYVFVSSVSAHRTWPTEPIDEDSPTWDSEADDYGARKAACERAAEAAMPGRVAQIRPGLIVGPHDYSFRFPWWVERIARGGEVLAPGDPERTVQLIDVRDLAAWMLELAERRVAGAFCATAPGGVTPLRAVLESAIAATGSDARLTWVPDTVLQQAGVQGWIELPLWMPEAEAPAIWRIGTARAEAAGLLCRRIDDTVRDVWAWLRDGGAEDAGSPYGDDGPAPGLAPERERELLAAFRT